MQGLGLQVVFSIINLNLPKSNILILSNGELKALLEGMPDGILSTPAYSAWTKVEELTASIKKEKEDAR